MRIAVVKEGFGHPQSQEANDALVREAADRLRGLGAMVEEVSIPMHALGAAIWLPVAAEGATVQMMHGNGFGFNWQGLYVNSLLDAHSAWRGRADELSETLKNTMLLGHYMVTRHRGHYYAKAQNLVRRLRKAYDDVLAQLRPAGDADPADGGDASCRRPAPRPPRSSSGPSRCCPTRRPSTAPTTRR